MTAPRRPRRSLVFERWPRFALRHPWWVLAGVVVVLAGCAALWASTPHKYDDSFSVSGTESQALVDLLKQRFTQTAGDTAIVAVRAPAGLEEPETRGRVQSLVAGLSALPDVVAVSSPYQQPGDISPDGTIARITVQYSKQAFGLDHQSVRALMDLRKQTSSSEFQVEVGGAVASVDERQMATRSEIIGVVAAIVILLIAFGSVVAMGLPIITAVLALVSGLLLIGAATSLVKMPSFTPQFGAMIGLGAGIDYALLIVTRFRQGLARRLSVEDAIVKAAATAGRSVAFAGTTVVIALLSLWTIGLPPVAYSASAASLVVAISVLLALVTLPALLSLAGARIDRWRIPLLAGGAEESESGLGYRWSRAVQRLPILWLVLSLGILLLLAVPLLDMRLGVADAGNNPTTLTSRRSYDLLSTGFGPGFNGPILVGVRLDASGAVEQVEQLPAKIGETQGVAAVSPARFNEARTAALITVIPSTAPQSEETERLVHTLRRSVHAQVNGAGAQAYVGGPTAMFIDIGDRIQTRMPIFFATVIGLSFVLLMVVFRSILIPLKAAVMNLLSISAAYGVIVAVFQWGWLGELLGIQRQGPIESFMPMFLFAVLFGLSMDYEVFLISRIREEYRRTGNNAEAVARGLSATTRVITAAAAIMVAVFLSFALGHSRLMKEFGLGLAVAIFLDATLVRLVLVPSTMQLLGDANWWFPRWLDRILPRISLDLDEQEGAPEPLPGERVVEPAGAAIPRAVPSPAVEPPPPGLRWGRRSWLALAGVVLFALAFALSLWGRLRLAQKA
ncbi:MAG: MMPL family transporter [Dehalococcoidia bacterium]|nr:MMPL family transporter [Dehalococcoidia bacterium]